MLGLFIILGTWKAQTEHQALVCSRPPPWAVACLDGGSVGVEVVDSEWSARFLSSNNMVKMDNTKPKQWTQVHTFFIIDLISIGFALVEDVPEIETLF